MNIIIAPHPDDELIGMYSLIRGREINSVIYIDPAPGRFERSQLVGKHFGFRPYILNFGELQNCLKKARERLSSSTIYVPDSFDKHPLHKAVNLIGRMSGCRLGYYTTDMNTGYVRELSEKEKKEKKEALDKFYPDQSSLWGNNWKYFLFEGVVYDTYTPSITV